MSGGAVSLRSVKTTGAISVTGSTSIALNATYGSQDGNISFTGAVTLGGSVSVDSDEDNAGTDGTIAFSLKINGRHP